MFNIPNFLLVRIYNYIKDCFNHESFWAKRWKKICVKNINLVERKIMDKVYLPVRSYPDIPSKEKDPNWRIRDDNWVVFQMNPESTSYVVLFRGSVFDDFNFMAIRELSSELFAMRVSEEPFEITTRKSCDDGALKSNSKLLKPICVCGEDNSLSTQQVQNFASLVGMEVTFI